MAADMAVGMGFKADSLLLEPTLLTTPIPCFSSAPLMSELGGDAFEELRAVPAVQQEGSKNGAILFKGMRKSCDGCVYQDRPPASEKGEDN